MWFSDDHKNLYSRALGALYDDVKNASSSLMDTTSKVLVSGYEKIKTTADYLDKRYHDDGSNNTNSNNTNFKSDYSTEEPSDIDNSEDTEDYIIEMGKIYPDILIKLNKNHFNINKIWVLSERRRILVRGKIASYPYVNNIIHEWFEYKTINERGHKWYPTNELYTAYRESSRRLAFIDNILFRYSLGGYKPHHWVDN